MKKHYCRICKNFFCSDEYKIQWVFENKSSPEREKVDGRCLSCWTVAENHIENLKNVMNEANHKVLLEQLELIENHDIEIDVKVLEEARILLEKLKTQVEKIQYECYNLSKKRYKCKITQNKRTPSLPLSTT